MNTPAQHHSTYIKAMWHIKEKKDEDGERCVMERFMQTNNIEEEIAFRYVCDSRDLMCA